MESSRSPYTKAELRRARMKSYEDFALTESDLSFVMSSDRASPDRMFPSLFNDMDGNRPPRCSNMTNADVFVGYENVRNNPPIPISSNNQSKIKDSIIYTKDDYSSFENNSTPSWSSQSIMVLLYMYLDYYI